MNDENCIGCGMLNNENTALAKENARLREALAQISDIVDDALLLDEELALAWDDIRNAVVKARDALEGK